MGSGNSVIEALAKAVMAAPDDTDLRLHLADVLLEAGSASDALDHFAKVLGADPTHVRALGGAHRAALEAGEHKRAAAYATILSSLGADPDEAPEKATVHAGREAERQRTSPRLRVVGGSDADEIALPPDDSRITLDDVAGLDGVKRRIELAFLGPQRNPAMSRAYGKKLKGGLMLYGPPGCGKTYIARALAGELGAGFFAIGLNDILDMYLGESEKRLHAIFERARHNAPTVLFMDELDALGRKRSDLGSSASREVVNQLLQELDGVSGHDDAVFVLGATNLPWDVDVALKRPGRFDRAIFVEPPDPPARKRLFELNLADRPVGQVDLDYLVRKTHGYSGADIAFVCELATESTLERAMKSGRVENITGAELKKALKETRASISSWFETARNYAIFANASGEFNDLAEYIERNRI